MATFFTIYIRDFRPFSPVLGPTFITDGGGSSLIAELNTTIEDDKKRKRQKHMHLNNLMRLGQFSFLLVGIKHHMYSCYVSDETGERKRTTRKINDQLEKCRWVESAHLSLSLAGSYVAERKANQRKAKLGFIFPVSFTLSLPLPLTLVHKIPILLCAKNPLFLSGPLASISPSGSTAGSELLYLCLRGL